MSLGTSNNDIFEAIFGDGSGLYKGEDGKWTFDAVPSFPKLPGEGVFPYLSRLAANCLIARGEWNADDEYQVNNVVAYDGQMWVAMESNSGIVPGESSWVPLFESLVGLQGFPGRDGYDAIVYAI